MRFGKIVVLSAFLCTSVANAQDVVVDLSVLDDLEASTLRVSKPLFPVLPKKVKADVKKVKSKTAPKKEKVKKKVEQVKQADDNIVVVDVEPSFVPKKDEAKLAVNKENKVQEKLSEEQNIEIKPVMVPDVKEKVAEETKDIVKEASKEVVVAPAVVTVEKTDDVKSGAENKASEEVAGSSANSDGNELIIKENVVKEPDYNQIKFADNVDELNETQMQKIDLIVSEFKNEAKNKIAIYSYNYDNGTDSFKKKRTSLNRAVEVRSYLLKKGYKNFSIKVININSASDKVNTVELQEI